MYDPATDFLAASRRYLTDDFLAKTRLALRHLSEEDVWWRPNAESNSVGNLLLHLAGNIRQWIVAGVGGANDVRDRPSEFHAAGGYSAEQAFARLASSVSDADGVLAALSPDRLGERRLIQGHDVTVLEAIYHVVEHFGMHTGQILYIVKARSGRDLGFYEVTGNLARGHWQDLADD